MPWSRAILSKAVAETKVMEFKPQKIELGSPEQALEYVRRKQGTDFRMNDHVQVYTGVDRIEQANDDERVEQRALEMLADVQKKAYDEAYQLGLDEGRKKAFDDVSADITKKMEELDGLLGMIGGIKNEILSQNETHMMKLLYHMASRIAGVQIAQDDSAVVEILRGAVSLAQDEENVRVEMHPSQIEFVEELRTRQGREFEFLKKIRFSPNESIRPGGCIVETNYGEIDARMETRLEQLWTALSEAVPKVKDRITGPDEQD